MKELLTAGKILNVDFGERAKITPQKKQKYNNTFVIYFNVSLVKLSGSKVEV